MSRGTASVRDRSSPPGWWWLLSSALPVRPLPRPAAMAPAIPGAAARAIQTRPDPPEAPRWGWGWGAAAAARGWSALLVAPAPPDRLPVAPAGPAAALDRA